MPSELTRHAHVLLTRQIEVFLPHASFFCRRVKYAFISFMPQAVIQTCEHFLVEREFRGHLTYLSWNSSTIFRSSLSLPLKLIFFYTRHIKPVKECRKNNNLQMKRKCPNKCVYKVFRDGNIRITTQVGSVIIIVKCYTIYNPYHITFSPLVNSAAFFTNHFY